MDIHLRKFSNYYKNKKGFFVYLGGDTPIPAKDKDTTLPEKVFSMSLMSLCHKPFVYKG